MSDPRPFGDGAGSAAPQAVDWVDVAKAQIGRLLLDYCRGVDRVDLDLVRSVYHADAVDHHTGFEGGVDDFIVWLDDVLGNFAGTMHFVSNQVVDVVGERAVSECYAMAVHWGTPPGDPTKNFTCGTRYVDRWEARNGTWGIVQRWAAREWTKSDADVHIPKAGRGPRGARGREDLIYASLEWLAKG
jgi:hypothetical protein